MANYKDVNKPSKRSKFKQGYYKLENPEKYIGDPTKIIYRSSWEYKFCKYCDLTADVIKWSSEPFPIKYFDPIQQKERSYFVDFYIRVKTRLGEINDYLVEIKPKDKLKPPVLKSRQTLKKLKEYNDLLQEFIINKAKKEAAEKFAASMNYKYMIVTEEFLNRYQLK